MQLYRGEFSIFPAFNVLVRGTQVCSADVTVFSSAIGHVGLCIRLRRTCTDSSACLSCVCIICLTFHGNNSQYH